MKRLRSFVLVLLFGLSFGLTLGFPLQPSAAMIQVYGQAAATEAIAQMETRWEQDYQAFFQRDFVGLGQSATEISRTLDAIDRQTGTKTAVLWVMSRPKTLNIALTTAQTQAYSVDVPITAAQLTPQVQKLRRTIGSPRRSNSISYQAPASLWYVSDTGTMGLMNEFYRAIANPPTPTMLTKAAALRQAQLAMLHGQVSVQQGQLHSTTEALDLPRDLADKDASDFSHPYHWAAYTMIGSPW